MAAGVNSDSDFGLTGLSSWSSERLRERETEWQTNRRAKTDIETERDRARQRHRRVITGPNSREGTN